MNFDATVRTILEGQTVEENYTLIKPMDYSDAIIRVILGDVGRKRYYEFYKVVNDKNKNLKYVKDGLFTKLPEEYTNGWVKKYLVDGRDIMYQYGLKEGEGFTIESFYIVKYPQTWDKSDMYYALLKPTGLSDDIKDVFTDMYGEI